MDEMLGGSIPTCEWAGDPPVVPHADQAAAGVGGMVQHQGDGDLASRGAPPDAGPQRVVDELCQGVWEGSSPLHDVSSTLNAFYMLFCLTFFQCLSKCQTVGPQIC